MAKYVSWEELNRLTRKASKYPTAKNIAAAKEAEKNYQENNL